MCIISSYDVRTPSPWKSVFNNEFYPKFVSFGIRANYHNECEIYRTQLVKYEIE